LTRRFKPRGQAFLAFRLFHALSRPTEDLIPQAVGRGEHHSGIVVAQDLV